MSKKGTETDLTKKFCGEIVRYNGVVIPMVAGKMQTPGLPDRYVCHASFGGLWIEFKRWDRKVTDLQRITIWRMLDRNVPVIVVRFLKDGKIVAELPCRRPKLNKYAISLCTMEPSEAVLLFINRARQARFSNPYIKHGKGTASCLE